MRAVGYLLLIGWRKPGELWWEAGMWIALFAASVYSGKAAALFFVVALCGICFSQLGYSAESRDNRWLFTLPVSRGQVVLAQYLFATGGLAWACLVVLAGCLLGRPEGLADLPFLFFSGTVCLGAMQPFLIYHGPERGRIVLTIEYILFYIVVGNRLIFAGPTARPAGAWWMAPAGLAVLAASGIAARWFYIEKEF